ncbi:MAG: type II toxin-antitoxin system HicB family antitoxin [Dehalococcoidia bacterium]|nr:type II toxin-antitoxin system HicB family antitoxin [Dehalococcoidia bacterium]
MKYAVVIEKAPNNYSAYVPDLPGCIAAAETLPEVETLIQEAIGYHLEMMREYGDPIPEPQAAVRLVEV